MKLTKAVEKKITNQVKHIVGECNCPATSKTCIYWKKVDGEDGWQTKEIIKLIKSL